MAITNLSELTAAVKDYLTDDDVSGRIEDFIGLAEVRFNSELKLRGMYKTITGTVDGKTVAVPNDYLEMEAFRITDPIPPTVLVYTPPDQFWDGTRSIWIGRPVEYTIQGDSFYLNPYAGAPQPGETGYSYQIDYFSRVPALTTQNPSNWLLAKYPNLYLYATLFEAQPYLLDDAGAPRWLGMYERAVNMAHSADMRGRFRPRSAVQLNTGYATDGAFKIIRGSGV